MLEAVAKKERTTGLPLLLLHESAFSTFRPWQWQQRLCLGHRQSAWIVSGDCPRSRSQDAEILQVIFFLYLHFSRLLAQQWQAVFALEDDDYEPLGGIDLQSTP